MIDRATGSSSIWGAGVIPPEAHGEATWECLDCWLWKHINLSTNHIWEFGGEIRKQQNQERFLNSQLIYLYPQDEYTTHRMNKITNSCEVRMIDGAHILSLGIFQTAPRVSPQRPPNKTMEHY